jgi:DNA topoisomerase-1
MSDAVSYLDKGIGTRSVVIDALNEALAPHFFPDLGNGKNPRACPSCAAGELGIKLAKNGAFIGCSNYPECRYTRPLAVATGEESEIAGPQILGTDPAGTEISLRKGPYGFYVQAGGAGVEKPKRVSLLKDMMPDSVDLETALKLLALPRDIGKHPETGETILAGMGRFGPYLKHGAAFKSIPKDDDVLSIGLNRAVVVLAEPSRGRGRAAAAPGREIGKHPADSAPVTVHEGRYGPYVKHGAVNATIPKDLDPATLSMDAAVALIAARADKVGTGKGGRKTAAKKPAAKKPAAKKAAAKKVSADGEAAPVKKPATKKAATTKTAAKKPAAKKPAAKTAAAKKAASA